MFNIFQQSIWRYQTCLGVDIPRSVCDPSEEINSLKSILVLFLKHRPDRPLYRRRELYISYFTSPRLISHLNPNRRCRSAYLRRLPYSFGMTLRTVLKAEYISTQEGHENNVTYISTLSKLPVTNRPFHSNQGF